MNTFIHSLFNQVHGLITNNYLQRQPGPIKDVFGPFLENRYTRRTFKLHTGIGASQDLNQDHLATVVTFT